MSAGSIEKRVGEIVERITNDGGLELVHVEVAGPEGKPIIRIFIDKPGGVTHQDCATVSSELGTILEVEDFIRTPYTLEVSSPGLERGLYKQEDYSRFAGKMAKVKTRVPVNGQRNFRGRIEGLDGSEIVFDDKISGIVRFPFDTVVKANLEIDVEEEFRRASERQAASAKLKDVPTEDAQITTE
jgi:ribosome maturation factor RimP